MRLVPDYEISLEPDNDEINFVLYMGGVKVASTAAMLTEEEYLRNMLLMIISKDADSIKKKYC